AGILFSLRAAMLKACFQHDTPTLRADTNRTASALRAVGISAPQQSPRFFAPTGGHSFSRRCNE
ncbi:MAG: hypothetical protein WC807_16660, partial [Hyphomicrobium sp.]